MNYSCVSFEISFVQVKLVFYLINTMSEDEETQRKGMITVAWLGSPTDKIIIPGTPGSDERVIIQSGITVAEALPVRVVAIHFWLPDTPLFRLLKSFYTFGAPVKSLSRYKFHIGKFLKLNIWTTTNSDRRFSFVVFAIILRHRLQRPGPK